MSRGVGGSKVHVEKPFRPLVCPLAISICHENGTTHLWLSQLVQKVLCRAGSGREMSLGFLQAEHRLLVVSGPVVVRHRINLDDDPSAGRRMSRPEAFEHLGDTIRCNPCMRQSQVTPCWATQGGKPVGHVDGFIGHDHHEARRVTSRTVWKQVGELKASAVKSADAISLNLTYRPCQAR